MDPNIDRNATALFTNFSSEEFVGAWNGKERRFAPGQQVYLPYWMASHFGKHLANRELLRRDTQGNPVFKDGEKMTSPKRPADVPIFMDLFNKAVKVVDEPQGEKKKDDIDAIIDTMNRNEGVQAPKVVDTAPKETIAATTEPMPLAAESGMQDPNEPQVVLPPGFDGGDDDEQSPNP